MKLRLPDKWKKLSFKWPIIFKELFLLIFGILIALWVNNLNNDSQNKEEAVEYLQNINANLQKDIQQLERLIEFKHQVIFNCKMMIDAYKNQETSNKYAFLEAITFILEEKRFTALTVGFDILKNSGKFRYLNNKNLQKELYEYYNLYEIIKIEDNTHNRFIQNMVEPYFYNNYGGIIRSHPNEIVRVLYNEDQREQDFMLERFLQDGTFEFIVFSTLKRANKMVTIYQNAIQKAKSIVGDNKEEEEIEEREEDRSWNEKMMPASLKVRQAD